MISYSNLSIRFINKILELKKKGEEFAVVEIVKTEGPAPIRVGNKIIITQKGEIEGWIGSFCTKEDIIKQALKVIEEGEPSFTTFQTYHGGLIYAYIEPGNPERKLIVAGINPISFSLANIARILGFITFNLSKVEDEKIKQYFDFVITLKDLFRIKIDKKTFAVIATLGEEDLDYLEPLLSTEIKYIGYIAGKRKTNDVLNYLREKGYSEETLSKIKAPAGLNIGAVSAEEIALSIIAEIISIHRKVIFQRIFQYGSKKGKAEYAIDPVCKMVIDIKDSKYYSEFRSEKVYFCSEGCKEKFDLNPFLYLTT